MTTATAKAVLLLLGITCLTIFRSASGAPIGDDQDQSKPDSEADAFEEDVEIVAKKYEWDVDSTREYLKQQAAFGALVNEVRSHAHFAGSEMPRKPGDGASIFFKGDIPKLAQNRAQAFIERTGFKPTLVGGMRYSEGEQHTRAHSMVDIAREKGAKQVGAAVHPRDGIVLTVSGPKDTFGDGEGEDLVLELLKGAFTDEELEGVHVAIAPNGGDVSRDHHTRGGRRITAPPTGSGTPTCTTGFTVSRDSDGVTGVATAAHCTGMNLYDAEPPEADYATNFRGQHNGIWGDIECHTTGHLEPNEYWASPTSLRDVNTVATGFSVNEVVCVHSRMQGTRTCDQVWSTFVIQGITSALVGMDDDNTIGGDSGGPYSFGTRASGIVKGSIWVFGWHGTFTKAFNLDSAVGVTILTT